MKICLITRSFSLKGGGIGRVGAEIRNKLLERGHEVHTISTNREGLVSYFKYTLLEIPFKLPRGMDIYHAITPMESIWIPKEKGVSIILDIIAITHPGRYGGRLRGTVTIHDLFPLTNPNQLGAGIGYSKIKTLIGSTYFKFACKQAIKCKYIVTVSEHVKREVVKYLGADPNKIKVIRSGINANLEPLPKQDGGFRVGYIGQLDRRKRVHLLIDAFKRSYLNELVLGGKGLDEDLLKKQAEGDKRIKFLGFVPDEKLCDFYNSLDVFIFPTAIEGYGLPPVEAMACKKPVVVLSDSIIPQEVKGRCVIVDKLDYALGDRGYLERLCKDVDYDSNYTFAKSHSWDKCIDQYLELYRKVLNG